MHIRKDDLVEVLVGDDRGKRAKVLIVLPEKRKVVVEGVNRVYKHMRRSQRNPQGGRLSKEMPVAAANVQLVCPQCGKATRMGKRATSDGGKERFCKKCGASINVISPPRTKPKAGAQK
ncbi:MAG: 50S ribosomal protein L24 [Planctomycetia bacterium]|nr:50S ribosomal protein L24 [Planctomycetia bacterium]